MANVLNDVRRILYGPALTVQLTEGPTMLSWPAYLVHEFKDLLWYLTTDSKAAVGYELSGVARAYLWAGVAAITAFGWWFLRKQKLI